MLSRLWSADSLYRWYANRVKNASSLVASLQLILAFILGFFVATTFFVYTVFAVLFGKTFGLLAIVFTTLFFSYIWHSFYGNLSEFLGNCAAILRIKKSLQ